jgi:hypothetical protein
MRATGNPKNTDNLFNLMRRMLTDADHDRTA